MTSLGGMEPKHSSRYGLALDDPWWGAECKVGPIENVAEICDGSRPSSSTNSHT